MLIIIMMTFPSRLPKHPRAWNPNRCTYLYARNHYSMLLAEKKHAGQPLSLTDESIRHAPFQHQNVHSV